MVFGMEKKGWREVVKDKRETENWDYEFALPAAAGVNLYDDETKTRRSSYDRCYASRCSKSL